MNILITGATGFIGKGVLQETLAAVDVDRVVVLGRSSTGLEHEKLTEILIPDIMDAEDVADQLTDLDACFWCLGGTSIGLDEKAYTRLTYTSTMHVARLLKERNREIGFCFLSGAGSDGKAMWARVKKRTEVELTDLGLGHVAILRPGYVRGLHGASFKSLLAKIGYAAMTIFNPIIRLVGAGTSNAEIGMTMLVAARERLDGVTLSSREINQTAKRA